MMRPAAIVLALPLALGHLDAQEQRRPPSISATGTVDVLLPPDRAVLAITLTAEGADIATTTTGIDSALASFAPVSRRRNLTVIPWGGAYGENPMMRRMVPGQIEVRTNRDYLGRSGLMIVIPNVGETNAVIREIAATGFRGSVSVLYSIDEASPALRAAHGTAVGIALQRANAMAAALGGRLGELISVSTPGGFYPQAMQRLQIHDGVNPMMQAGDVMLRVAVTGSWTFINQ